MKKILFPASLLFLLVCLIPLNSTAAESIRCASTTATQNSGLLDFLLPVFKANSGIDVEVVGVDTDTALELGKKGEVDCVMVHDRDLEIELVDEGYFIDREEFMYNDFVILGPAGDPAGVKETGKVSEAFTRVRDSASSFISRGDNSGVNMRENRIWLTTGKMPSRSDKWYHSTGQDMAESIRVAAEKRAYTISDRATWLSMQDGEKLDLGIVLEGDETLFNQYGVMIVNPARHKDVDYRLARNFVIWLTSPAGQRVIGNFKDKSGNVLFTPNAR